jgi:hypothetical protein
MVHLSDALTEKISLQLNTGNIIRVEVNRSSRTDVSKGNLGVKSFQVVTDALEDIVSEISSTLERANPDKATVKFGIELAVESGQLTAVLIKGSSKANLEITLEWNKFQSIK